MVVSLFIEVSQYAWWYSFHCKHDYVIPVERSYFHMAVPCVQETT